MPDLLDYETPKPPRRKLAAFGEAVGVFVFSVILVLIGLLVWVGMALSGQ